MIIRKPWRSFRICILRLKQRAIVKTAMWWFAIRKSIRTAAASAGRWKNNICLKQIGEPKSSCIMIGDSLTSDMLGAKNASLDSVWFMPSGDIEKAMKEYCIDYCAASFDELFSVLEKWSGKRS